MGDDKAMLHGYLRSERESVLWKLKGLSEYQLRSPHTPTGTNLLGLVKHLTAVELGYFGEVFGRRFEPEPAWCAPEAPANSDMWATAEEPSDCLIGLYRTAIAHADETIDSLGLDAVGDVPWWPEDRRRASLRRILVHMIVETGRHAGHADIVREQIDGVAGIGPDDPNLPGGAFDWAEHRSQVQTAADAFA